MPSSSSEKAQPSELKRRGTRRAEDEPKLIGQWRTGRIIGKGSSGRVKIATHVRTGQRAAVKIVSKHALMNSRLSMNAAGEHEDKILLAIEREIVIMKLVDHPNVLSLYDVWETSDELYLIMEYVEGGELFDYLVSRGRLSLPEALHYFQQIISAVDYCHRFNIAHRDLKPENLLLDRSRRNIKVADFGMAAWEGGSAAGGMLETSCGSPHYASPEIVMGKKYSGACSDIWSCGVILYALCTGRLPFDHPDIRTLLQLVKKGEYVMPTDLPGPAKHLIARMLEKDVSKRITMPEILQHPFFVSRPPRPIAGRVVSPPTLEEVARPVNSVADIDADIFSNLRTLWHGAPDEDIIQGLLNNEKTWEKAVYHLLLHFRARHLENYNMDEPDLPASAPHQKRHRPAPAPPQLSPQQEAERASTPVRTPPPPRPSAPTPKRAGGSGSGENTPKGGRMPIFRGAGEGGEAARLLALAPAHTPPPTSRSPRPLPTPALDSPPLPPPPPPPASTKTPRLEVPHPYLEPAAQIDERSAVPAIALQTPTPQRTPDRPSPTPVHIPVRTSSPASVHSTGTASLASPSSLASSTLVSPKLPIAVPRTNDPAVQQFFNEIVDHLNKIELRQSLFVGSPGSGGATSPTPSTASNTEFPMSALKPFTLANPPPPTPATASGFSLGGGDPTQFEDAREEHAGGGQGRNVGLGISGEQQQQSEMRSPVIPQEPFQRTSMLGPPQLRSPPPGAGVGNRGSAPPSARRPAPTPTRTRARSMDSPSREDKENHRAVPEGRNSMDPRELGREAFVVVDREEAVAGERERERRRDGRSVLGERHVQIVLPRVPERTIRKKKSMISRGSLGSNNSSEDIPLTPPTSFTHSQTHQQHLPTPPKRTWFGNLFSFKPPSYELLSRYNMAVSRDECRKMLQNVGVAVLLQNSEGAGVLKCRLDEIRDPAGVMAVVKAVRFRVEFHLTTSVQNAAGYTTVLTLVQEKGAASTLKLVYARLRQDWEGSMSSPRTPGSDQLR